MNNFKTRTKAHKCTYCGKEIVRYVNIKTKNVFCSRECHNKYASIHPQVPRKGIIIECPICHKEFYISKTFIGVRKYCSYECHNKGMIKRNKILCKTCGKEFLKRPCRRKAKYCSPECSNKRPGEQRGKNWKGGITKQRKKFRHGEEYKKWRKSIFERDDYTCKACGARSKKGKLVILNAHHIKHAATHPELRLDVDNGITLCESCHYKVHRKKNKVVVQYSLL